MRLSNFHKTLHCGVAIPAHPLALTAQLKLDERRQRALSRYYIDSGVGGLAVGVHTTQFAIHDPQVGLLEPVLSLAAEEMTRADENRDDPLVRVAGVCGKTQQAVQEAELAKNLGYHAGLLSLSALKDENDEALIAHCRAVAEVIPVFGFYLQASVGGRALSYNFWRQFAEIENVVAIKMAPFNRYQTLDVIQAVVDAGRDDIALYTGNDDTIVSDLLTTFPLMKNGKQQVNRRIVGGLLGHWAVWTSKAVEMMNQIHATLKSSPESIPSDYLKLNVEVTDCNAVLFDVANNFRGCVPGIHEVLRRQGLLDGVWCLDPEEVLGPGQVEHFDRIAGAYPHLFDDEFVKEHRDQWLSG